MKKTINNDKTRNKELVYCENFFTGKKTITYDDERIESLDNKTFKVSEEVIKVEGNVLRGQKMSIFGGSVELYRGLYAYEIVFAILILALSSLFGLIGFVFGAIFAYCYIATCRNAKTAFLNTLMFIGYALLGMGLGFLAIFAFNGFAILII